MMAAERVVVCGKYIINIIIPVPAPFGQLVSLECIPVPYRGLAWIEGIRHGHRSVPASRIRIAVGIVGRHGPAFHQLEYSLESGVQFGLGFLSL